MANLNIEGASQGFDPDGVETYIKDLQTNFIDKAISQLKTELKDVNDTVDSVWQGVSAETFKKNMEHDVDVIIEAIKTAENVMLGAIYNTEQNFKNLDETLVTKRY